MIKIIFISVVALSGFSLLFSFNKKNAEKKLITKNGFAVVELFTSEGCSSCPPSDEAVADLQKEFPNNVYVLGFHVDYWDRLGWKDIYSSKAFTERQSNYADAFSLSSIYTPQVVVNGEKEFVGSNRDKLFSTVKDELAIESTATITLKAVSDKNNITVSYNAASKEKAVINFALVQLSADTDVKRGENGGRKLHHINVVRGFKTVEADAGNISFTLPAGLMAKEVKVVAYVQQKANLKVIAASYITL